MMIDLAFALRDHMRRSGPVRHQASSGGGTVELRAISHRGFAFEVMRQTFIWEEVRLHVRRLKYQHPAFLQLLEHPGDITWIDALRSQDALRELWSLMRPVDEVQLEPRPRPVLELPPVAHRKKAKTKPGWKTVAVVERGELTPFDFVCRVAVAVDQARTERQHGRALRRRWERTRCVIEQQI